MERRRVLQTAVCPKGVHATLNAERGVDADVALEDLTVITNLSDNALGSLRVENKLGTLVTFQTKETLDLWVIGLIADGVYIGRSNSKLFSVTVA